VRTVEIDPNSPSTLYAGTFFGGMYKSTDSGTSWTPLTDPDVLSSIADIAVDPSNSSVAYCACEGVYKTTDGGTNWGPANSGLPSGNVSVIVINPANPMILYAGLAIEGVYKSTDAGGSWAPANNGLTSLNIRDIAIDPGTPSTLYVATQGGAIFKSTDDGGSWIPKNNGIDVTVISSLTIDPTNPNTVYAAISSQFFKIFKTTDGGENWSQMTSSSGMGAFVSDLLVDPINSNIVYAATSSHGVFQIDQSAALFFDDFNDDDAADWTVMNGAWKVSGGILIGNSSRKGTILAPFSGCSVCTVEADMKIVTPGSRASLLAWYIDKKNFVELLLKSDSGKWILKQRRSGVAVAKTKFVQPIAIGQNYRVKLAFDGNRFLVSIDGVDAFSLTSASVPSGTVGFRVKSTNKLNATSEFNEIIVY
jgi:photosystem II stability/assembly factor-like uncharacterized protein